MDIIEKKPSSDIYSSYSDGLIFEDEPFSCNKKEDKGVQNFLLTYDRMTQVDTATSDKSTESNIFTESKELQKENRKTSKLIN